MFTAGSPNVSQKLKQQLQAQAPLIGLGLSDRICRDTSNAVTLTNVTDRLPDTFAKRNAMPKQPSLGYDRLFAILARGGMSSVWPLAIDIETNEPFGQRFTFSAFQPGQDF